MKKFLSFALAMVLAVSAMCMTGCGTQTSDDSEGDLLDQIRERGYITIATEGDWSPWTYHDESGELVGFDVEVGKAIAEYLGVEARFEETTWDSILAGVESGRFDLACNGVGYTEKRAESYRFSDPYVYTKTVLIVNADNTEINSFEDLAGKTTANTASSNYAALAEQYGATVTPVDDLQQTIELLTSGRIDATINADVSYYDYMAQHPETNIRIADSADPEKVCYPVALNDSTVTLMDEINACLQDMRDSGQLSALSVKYFNADMTNP